MVDLILMNETDVREIIVRPLLHRLGYLHGSENHIRTEYPLRYSRQFLGRKKPKTDPALRGRADYICDVVGVARFVVEVKAPSEQIDLDAIEQAFTYAAHPEIAAAVFMLTNGKEFKVFSLLDPRQPLLAWSYDETESMWIAIKNCISPSALRAKSEIQKKHMGKPLGIGLGTRALIVGGVLTYTDYESDDELHSQALQAIKGMRASAIGDFIERSADGRIRSRLRLAGPTPEWDTLNRMAGVEAFDFETSDEYISSSIEAPTIFQGVAYFSLAAGTPIGGGFPGIPAGTKLPCSLNASAFSQAIGFLEGTEFRGIFTIEYSISVPGGPISTMFSDGICYIRLM